MTIGQKGSRHPKTFYIFFSVEFYYGHFKPICDEQLSKVKILGQLKSAKSSKINFDPTFRVRKEVQKNKTTPYCLTEFHGESENNNRFSPREPSFRLKMVFKKNGS